MIDATIENLDAALVNQGLGWVEGPLTPIYKVRVLAPTERAQALIQAAGFAVIEDLSEDSGPWHSLQIQKI